MTTNEDMTPETKKILDYIKNSDDLKFVLKSYTKLNSILKEATQQKDANSINTVLEINDLMIKFRPHINQKIMEENETAIYNIIHNKKNNNL